MFTQKDAIFEVRMNFKYLTVLLFEMHYHHSMCLVYLWVLLPSSSVMEELWEECGKVTSQKEHDLAPEQNGVMRGCRCGKVTSQDEPGWNPKLVRWTLFGWYFNAVIIEFTIDTEEILTNSEANDKEFKNGIESEARSLDDLGRILMESWMFLRRVWMVKLVSSRWNLVGL